MRCGVGGIDSFGRVGPWSAARTVQVDESSEPGVPDAVTARYADPDDPTLTDSARAPCAGTPGLVVEWTWPAGRRLRAPSVDAGEFRVYLRRGDPNLVSGTVIDVDRSGRTRRGRWTMCCSRGAATAPTRSSSDPPAGPYRVANGRCGGSQRST